MAISIATNKTYYYGFNVPKGAAFGNIMGQLYVYMGERSANTIKVWTRSKSECNGDIEWQKVTLTSSHKRWTVFNFLDISIEKNIAQISCDDDKLSIANNDFVIEDGVLIKYKGNDSEVIIPRWGYNYKTMRICLSHIIGIDRNS